MIRTSVLLLASALAAESAGFTAGSARGRHLFETHWPPPCGITRLECGQRCATYGATDRT